MATWPTCALLLPHALAVVNHSQTFNVETGETVGLRHKAGQYLFIRGQYRQALTLQEHVLAVHRRVPGRAPRDPDGDEQCRRDPPGSW